MDEYSTLNTKSKFVQMLEDCKKYYSLENEIAILKNERTTSENLIHKLKKEIYGLVQQVEDQTPVDTNVLKQEIDVLLEDKSKLGFFAFKRLGEINSLLKGKQKELTEATYKNSLIIEIQKKKKTLECEEKKQRQLRNAVEAKNEEFGCLATSVQECSNYCLSIPEDDLYSLVIASGEDMVHLPNAVLRKVISKAVPKFVKDMPVHRQVKLLYPYDTTICFGGREWNVLEVYSDKALLLLRGSYASPRYYRKKYGWEEKAPCANAFDRGNARELTWASSEARKILNTDFVNSLHLRKSEEILPGYNGDLAFCLSKDEASRHLAGNQLYIDSTWWLRDTKYDRGMAEYDIAPELKVAFVNAYGSIEYTDHCNVSSRDASATVSRDLRFRPALWVKLPHDSLDTEWKENMYANCIGKWAIRDSYPVPVFSDVELTPDVIERINKAAHEAVHGPSRKELPDFIVVPRIDVSDM